MSNTIQAGLDAGRDQPAYASAEDRLASVMRGAQDEFTQAEAEQEMESEDADDADPAYGAEGESEDVEADDVSEDHEEDAEAESEDEAVAPVMWDGNPDNVPDELRPGFDHMMSLMNKGVNKKLRELADERKQVEMLGLQYQQMLMQMQQQGAQGNQSRSPSGPPEMPGPDATDADWKAYDQANREYLKNDIMNELRSSGALPDPKQFEVMRQQQDIQRRTNWVMNQDGVNDDIVYELSEMIQSEPEFQGALDTDQTTMYAYKVAVERWKAKQVAKENEELKKKASESVAAQAKRKAGAAKRATPRSGGRSAEKPEEKFSREAFPTFEEYFKHVSNEVLDEARNK